MYMYIQLYPVLDLAEEVWETFPACYTAQKNVAFMEISSKVGSQKAPELPLDLTLVISQCIAKAFIRKRAFLAVSHAAKSE